MSSLPAGVEPDLDARLEDITSVLVRVARGDFAARAQRSHRGDPWDVLAFMVNATVEEVAHLVGELEAEKTQLRETRAQLIEAERLAALGELAGGVAHEMNQPLTAILALSEVLLERPNATIAERQREVELIARAGKKLARIVSAVRTFGRRAPLTLRDIELRTPVEDALVLMAEALRSAGVRVALSIDPDVPRLRGDAESLEQVVIILLSNAKDALERHNRTGDRQVTVRVSTEGASVIVEVLDNGPGVPEEQRGRIFEPFFSTKPLGQGTGLGLSIAHGIVLEHGGSLEVDRAEGGGACFRLRLPIHRLDTSSLPAVEGSS